MSAYVATGERLEVQVFDAEDGSARVFGAPHQAVPLSASDMVRHLTENGYVESMTVRDLPNWPRDKAYPATRGIQIDGLGSVWVAEFWHDDDAPIRWTVFNPEGVPVATVTPLSEGSAGLVDGITFWNSLCTRSM